MSTTATISLDQLLTTNSSTPSLRLSQSQLLPNSPSVTQTNHQVTVTVAMALIMLIISIFGAISNLFTIIIFTAPSMRSPINTILSGLSIIDSCVILVSIPLLILPRLNPNWVSIYCVIYLYPFAMIWRTCSVWTFVLITFERFLAVCHPFKGHRIRTNKQAKAAVLYTVFVAFLYNFIRFWEFSITPSARVEFLLRAKPIYMNLYYTSLFLLTHFLIPFCILIIFNTFIIQRIRKMRREREELSRQIIREHRTAHMMVVIIVVFIVTNTLPYIQNIIEAIHPIFFQSPDTLFYAVLLSDISNVLVVINSSTNSIVYYLFSKRYQTFLCRLLKCRIVVCGGNTTELNNHLLSRPSLYMYGIAPHSSLANRLNSYGLNGIMGPSVRSNHQSISALERTNTPSTTPTGIKIFNFTQAKLNETNNNNEITTRADFHSQQSPSPMISLSLPQNIGDLRWIHRCQPNYHYAITNSGKRPLNDCSSKKPDILNKNLCQAV